MVIYKSKAKGEQIMWIKEEVTTGYQLERRLWGQAVDTWKEIFNAGKEEQAMQYFEEIFCDQEAIDLTTINDILAYDSDSLMEYLGLNEEEEEEQELILNESDIDTIEEQNELLGNYLRERLKGNVTPYLSTTINDIEEDCGIELSDEEKEMLIDLG